VQNNGNPAQFAEFEDCGAVSVLGQFEAELWVGDAPPMFLEPWKASLHMYAPSSQFPAVEEIIISFSKSVSAVLEYLRVDVVQFRIGLFSFGDELAELRLPQSLPFSFVRVLALLQKPVVQSKAEVELMECPCFLFPGRIDSVPESPQPNLHAWLCIKTMRGG